MNALTMVGIATHNPGLAMCGHMMEQSEKRMKEDRERAEKRRREEDEKRRKEAVARRKKEEERKAKLNLEKKEPVMSTCRDSDPSSYGTFISSMDRYMSRLSE